MAARLVWQLWVASGWMQVPIGGQLGKGFLGAVLGQLGPAGGWSGDGLAHTVEWRVRGTRLASMLAAGIVVTGGVSSLVDPIHTLEGAEAYAFHIRQRQRLRTYVNAAAALLVVTLLFQIAWMRWSLVAVDSASASLLGRHIDAFAIFAGVTGSVVIALFAVPASTILASRAEALPRVPGADHDAPLLDASLLPSLSKVLVILAPTVAGSLPALADLVAKMTGG